MSIIRDSYFSESLNMKQFENLEDFIVIWYDTSVNQSKDCIDFQSRLRCIINYLMVFDECTPCQEYLSSVKHENVFLIVSGQDGESLTSHVHDFIRVRYIYVYCFEKFHHEVWARKYSKIRGVYDNKDELLIPLKRDVSASLFDLLPIRALSPTVMQKTIKELNEEGGLFLWSHFLVQILRNMQHDIIAKKELIDLSRQQYSGNDKEFKNIIDFESNYTCDKALLWYTKDSFLYRILNKALRTENFDVIYKFRLFIADLHKQLKSKHRTYIDEIFSSQKEDIFPVYRGQRLVQNEFTKFQQNINGFISMNTFLSTTTQSDVALLYSGNGEDRPQFESVLFQINIGKSYSTEPFANINDDSFFESENEVLFTIGSIFRIESVSDLTPTIWLIELSLVKHNDDDMEALSQFLNESVGSEPTLKDLNSIFLQIDDYQRVVHYSEVFLSQVWITDIDRATTYFILGDAELHINGDYTKAEKYFLNAKKIMNNLSPLNYQMFEHYYDSMGLLYIERNESDAALEALNTALQIAKDHLSEPRLIAMIYSNLGLAYRRKFDYNQAYENYEKALYIMTNTVELPKLHPTLAVIHNNLAYTKQLQGYLDDALNHYMQALDIEKKALPVNHSILGTTLNNIGLLHMMKHENEKAFIVYDKVLNIFENIYGSDHPRLAAIYNNLGDICLLLDKNHQAKEYLEKALNIRLNHSDIDIDDHAATLTSLGIVHCHLQSFDDSLRCCSEALNIRLKIPESSMNKICDTYMALTEYYLAKFDYDQSLHYCKLSLSQSQSQPIKLAAVNEQFGHIYSHMGQFDDAISYYKTSLNIQLKFTTQIDVSCAQIHKNIGMMYSCKMEYNKALQCFTQALDLASNNPSLILGIHQIMAEIFISLKQYDQVIEHLNQAKTISDNVNLDKLAHMAESSRIMGILNYEKGNFSQAKKDFNEALLIYRKKLSEFHESVCDIYLKLGYTLEKLGKVDETLEIFEKVKNINKIIYPRTHPLVASSYHRISIILRDKGLLQESLDNAKEALNLAKIASSINYHELARIYDTLSSIYVELEDLNQARTEIQSGFYIRQLHCPNDLVLSQINLVSTYIHEKDIEKATKLLDDINDNQLFSVHIYTPAQLGKDIASLYNDIQQNESALRMITFALNHVTVEEYHLAATIHFIAAKICWTFDRKPQTLEHLNQALELLDDSTDGYYHDTIAHIYKNKAQIFKSLGDYREALNAYTKMLKFSQTVEFALIHNNIGLCYVALNEMDLALENYNLALSMCSPTDYELLADIHDEIGRYYVCNENKIEALKYFEITLNIRLCHNQIDDTRFNVLYQDLGHLYLEFEKYQEATKCFEQLLERQLKQNDHKLAVDTFTLLGITHMRQDNTNQAIEYYNSGLQLCLNMSTPNYETAAYIYSHLGEVYDSQCNVWKCVESYDKAVEMTLKLEPCDHELLTLFQENAQMARQNLITAERKIREFNDKNNNTT